MRTASRLLLISLLLLAGACGIKVDLPNQIPSTEPFSEDDYTITFQWLVPGVTEMLVGRNTGIFYVIQDSDSLSIYPAYRQTTLVELTGKRLFRGLTEPMLLADGMDEALRIWVYDAGDEHLKAFDGSEFLDSLDLQFSYRDPAWQQVIAIAADDDGHVFVADRTPNKVYRYRMDDTPGGLELVPDGELRWTSQGAGATVRDIAYVDGRILLLDDGLCALQVLDPISGPLDPPIFEYFSDLLDQPVALVADVNHFFVVDRADTTVWEIGRDLVVGDALRVNSDDLEILLDPAAITLNDGRVYVADPTLGKIIDYEKRQ